MASVRPSVRVSAVVIVALAFLVGGPAVAGVHGAAAGATPVAHPTPLIPSLGVVTIYANGTISDPSAPITASSGTYTLTANLNGELRVLASDVVLNGAGFTVNYTVGLIGGDNRTVELTNATHVTVEDLKTANGTVGVWLFNASVASVTGVTADRLPIGIAVANSSGVSIDGNSANYSTKGGVEVSGSSGVTVSNNWLSGNGNASSSYTASFDTSSDLTVTGNHGNDSDYGIEVDYSRNALISANNDSFSTEGVGAYYDENVAVTNNVAFDTEYGTWAEGSQNLTVSGNSEAHDYEPLYDYYDRDVNFSNNYAPYNGGYPTTGAGIWSYGSVNSTFYSNNLSHSLTQAAYIEEGTSINLVDNNLTGAADYAAELYDNYGAVTLAGNDMSASSTITAPTYQVYVDGDYGTTLLEHNAMDNLYYGVEVYDSWGSTVLNHDSIVNASDAAVYEEYSYGPLTVENSDLNGSYYGVEVWESYGGSLTVASNWMNGSYYAVEDEDYDYGFTPVSVSNNVVTHSEEGIYLYEIDGPVSVTGNDVAFSGEYGITVEYAYYGSTMIADNNVGNASYEGIYVYEGTNVSVLDNWAPNASSYAIDVEDTQGETQVVGNSVQGSLYIGIYVYDSYSGAVIADNNVTNSDLGLYLEDIATPVILTGNIATNNQEIYLYADDLTQVSGNDFLNSALLELQGDTIGLFYHNDVNSSSFDPLGDTISGTWNAPYPVGGNYWTGYAGHDQYSGPSQNIAGSDGIGDTAYVIATQTDQYPLLKGWFNPTTTFTESGLAAGATWTVKLGGVTQSGMAGAGIVFPQADGAWTTTSYVASGPAGYTASPATSGLTLKDANLVIPIAFTPVTYVVTVNETGLPSGAAWGIHLTSGWTNGTGASLTLTLANGSYPYTVALVTGYLATPSTGTITVNGHAVTLTIAFAAATSVTYTFVETGLPSGASWTVTFDGTAKSSMTNSIVFQLSAGAYSYTISGPSGYTMTPSSGSVTPTGGDVTVYVAATTSAPGTTSTSSGGSNVSSDLFYGVLAGLIVALILAALGWAMYARRRSSNPPTTVSPPPAGGGVKAWDESSTAAGGATAPPPGAAGSPPPPSPPPR